MANVELKEYLGHVLEAEKNAHIMKHALNRINKKINSLGRANVYNKPTANTASLLYNSTEEAVGASVIMAICGAALGMVINMLYVTFFVSWPGFFASLVYNWIPIIIGAVVFVALLLGKQFFHWSKMKSEYNASVLRHSALLSKDDNRVKSELLLKENMVQYRNDMKIQHNKNLEVMNKLYSLGILHPQYRNIAAVASIFQFIDTGMCYELEGPGGAYAMFFHESWYKNFNSKFDNIIERLDDIHYSQQILIDTLESANKHLNKLTQTSEMTLSYAQATSKNSAVIAYNTEVTKRNTEVIAWMSVMDAIDRI
ncbi:MAG: hypothetical protein FWD98_08950 [Defluviitaleaceae bacterium]|nr:hypothetical protein [Defluviitaleaceae bacterium]